MIYVHPSQHSWTALAQADGATAMGVTGGCGLQVRDGDQVMVCLKRALKIAHAAQQQLAIALRQSDTMPAALFVEILNHYLYYFDQGLALISSTVLQVSPMIQPLAVPAWNSSLTVVVCMYYSGGRLLWP